ncbi:MAG: MmcQ/YjbR family DNA-binding protein, partial [Gaiellaceae bacterium]
MVTIDEVRAFAVTLPRSSEALVRGRVKFRVGQIVFVALSRDEKVMGFGFPKDWR